MKLLLKIILTPNCKQTINQKKDIYGEAKSSTSQSMCSRCVKLNVQAEVINEENELIKRG